LYYPNVQVTLLLLMTILLNCIFRCTDYVDKFSIETLPSHFTSWFSNGCNNNLHAKIQDLLQKCHINKIFVQKGGIFNINSNRARLQKWKNKTKKNQKKSEKSKKRIHLINFFEQWRGELNCFPNVTLSDLKIWCTYFETLRYKINFEKF